MDLTEGSETSAFINQTPGITLKKVSYKIDILFAHKPLPSSPYKNTNAQTHMNTNYFQLNSTNSTAS